MYRSTFVWTAILSLVFAAESMAPAKAQTITAGTQCSRPGPINDSNCTVMYRVANNPANNIVCVWIKEVNGLFACEGRTLWGGGFDGIPSSGRTLEFRRHADWPASHPSWPSDPAAVRNSGTLLKSQFVTSRYRTSPSAACAVTVAPGQNIQSAINAASVNATICLGAGIHTVASTIKPKAGQTLRSTSASNQAVLRPSTERPLVIEAPDVTVKELGIEGTDAFRPGYGALIYGTGAKNILLDKVRISKALIGLGITAGASNIELRQSEIAYAGDGQACSGCAHPSIWINDSNDVRIMKSSLINNGASPEGDGELACYNSPGLVVHNSIINNSGAAGMYLVNCDYAVVSGNDILSAGEWGIDLVDTGQPSGTDYGLFSWNLVEGSRHGAGVVLDSLNNTFQNNTYNNNRQGPNASGSCNGINRRGNTSGYYYINDVASPWPVVCND